MFSGFADFPDCRRCVLAGTKIEPEQAELVGKIDFPFFSMLLSREFGLRAKNKRIQKGDEPGINNEERIKITFCGQFWKCLGNLV